MEDNIPCIQCNLRKTIGRWGDDILRKHSRSLKKAKLEHQRCNHAWEYNHDHTYKFCFKKCGLSARAKENE